MRPSRRNTRWTNPDDRETIDHAWWTVQHNSIVAPCRDVIDFADYESREPYIKSAVLQQLGNLDKSSIDVEFWKAPRSNGVCRLVSLPDVVTRVTLQSLGLAISQTLNSQLSASVISRPGPLRSTAFMDGWYSQWSQYFARIMRIIDKCRYVIVADFTSFFDTVNLEHLRGSLQAAGVHGSQAKTACQLLRKCSYGKLRNDAISLGLPQLYDDTPLLLGNFYLRQFDAEVSSKWGLERYARWLDDIVLGAQTESEAWSALAHLSVLARNSGLNLNPYKARVISSGDMNRKYLFSNEHKKLDTLEIEILLRQDSSFNVKVKQQFADILEQFRTLVDSGLGDILLRRIYRLGSLMDSSHLLPFVATDLARHPNSASAICQYLASISPDSRIAGIVARYLEHPSNVYQTVEVSLLLSLLRREFTSETKKQVSNLARAILSGRISVNCDTSSGIAALVLHRCAGSAKAARTLVPLRARLMAVSGQQARRYAFTAIWCALPFSKTTKVPSSRILNRTPNLEFLYNFLASRDFNLDDLFTQTVARVN
jgi:hypothetical protein